MYIITAWMYYVAVYGTCAVIGAKQLQRQVFDGQAEATVAAAEALRLEATGRLVELSLVCAALDSALRIDPQARIVELLTRPTDNCDRRRPRLHKSRSAQDH